MSYLQFNIQFSVQQNSHYILDKHSEPKPCKNLSPFLNQSFVAGSLYEANLILILTPLFLVHSVCVEGQPEKYEAIN